MRHPILTALALLGSGLACETGPATAPRAQPSSAQQEVAATETTAALEAGLTLPYGGTVNSAAAAFRISQIGSGRGGHFEISNSVSGENALVAASNAVGSSLLAWNLGRGHAAIVQTTSVTNTMAPLEIRSQSLGNPTSASALELRSSNPNSTFPAVQLATSGKGPVLNVSHKGTTGALATFQVGTSTKIRFTRAGKGIFDDGTQTGGADVAEAFEVEGPVHEYEAGDVLVISSSRDRTVEKSQEPYSTSVAGVYATKPGVLLTERGVDDSMSDVVPLGVIGVIPTKVTSENGAIRRGDLLVSASTPGHAMLGSDRSRLPGAVIGKALEEFSGAGEGVIKVLVNAR